MADRIHRYRTELAWSGSTGAGYDGYGRAHDVGTTRDGPGLAMSSDPAFGGDATLLNPEQLVVMAASSCQLLSFLAVAARARIDVLAYRDEAEAEMPESKRPMRLARITLNPVITISGAGDGRGEGPTPDRLQHLVEVAHRECFIANSLSTEVVVRAAFVRQGPT